VEIGAERTHRPSAIAVTTASYAAGAGRHVESVDLSIVVLAWNNLDLTRACVDSIRNHSEGVSYELILVDNGSDPDAASYAEAAADRAILNSANLGFARGMNQGLAASNGEFVAFCNNDTVMPASWAARLLETARADDRAGIVVPAVTAAPNPVTVRTAPGTQILVLDPFSAPPAAVIYLMRRELMAALGSWEEEYEIASGEDVDLCFKVWVNGLDVVLDERVLVQHVGHATASLLGDWQQLWARNRRQFIAKWSGDADPPRLPTCGPEIFSRNRATARAVAGWMDKYFTTRDRALGQVPASADGGRGNRRSGVLSRSVRRLRRLWK
jgi:GT2 family glycosyltransferase